MANIEARCGNLDEIMAINETITEWDNHFSRERFEKVLANRDYLISIGTVDGKPAGFSICWIDENKNLKTWVSGVSPDYRREGVYSAICGFYENWAKNKDVHKVILDVAQRRRGMIATSIKLEYKFIGFEFGEDLDNSRIFFEKQI